MQWRPDGYAVGLVSTFFSLFSHAYIRYRVSYPQEAGPSQMYSIFSFASHPLSSSLSYLKIQEKEEEREGKEGQISLSDPPVVVVVIAVLAKVDLLLQDDAVHAGLEEREDEARLALELAQAVEDGGRGLVGHGVEDGSELGGGGEEMLVINIGIITGMDVGELGLWGRRRG
ncbi:hypothetical protein F5B18DRAFT_368732 [Nemania serpens]|nr:hypothetical protein F5B18DRAFT_368732 [Nemania serpens]